MRSSRHNQRWPRPRDGPSHRLAITVPCCAHFREGPVLAILATLALKDALCVAPGGSAPLFPFRSAPWPPMFQAGTGKRRLNRTRKPARHDRSHALTTQKGTSWRCGNRGHFGVALTGGLRGGRSAATRLRVDHPMQGLHNALGNRGIQFFAAHGSLAPLAVSARVPTGTVQRSCACDGKEPCECDKQAPSLPWVQRKAIEGGAPAPLGSLASTALSGQGSGRPLDRSSRVFMEPRFGRDLGGVRIHTDAAAARAAKALNAEAFTVGGDIHFAEGRYQPDTLPGRHLLAHELTHTVQQEGRRAGGSVSMSSAAVSQPRDAAEQEAEGIADRVAEGSMVEADPIASPVRIQRQDDGSEASSSTEPEEQVCRPEDPLCQKDYGESLDFEGYTLSTDAGLLREQLIEVLKTLGRQDAYGLIDGLEETLGGQENDYDTDDPSISGTVVIQPHGVGATEKGIRLIPPITMMMRGYMQQFEQEHVKFKQLVRAAAQVLLERNREVLGQWITFLTGQASPEQVSRQVFGEAVRDMGMRVVEQGPQAEGWFNDYLTTHYQVHLQNPGGHAQGCHSLRRTAVPHGEFLSAAGNRAVRTIRWCNKSS